MNKQKSNKAGILKCSFMASLALMLIFSGNTHLVAAQLATAQEDSLPNPKSSLPDTVKAEIPPADSILRIKTTNTTTFSIPITESTADTTVHSVSKKPETICGVDAMADYVSKFLRYPEEANKAGVAGTVTVRFLVNKYGQVEKANVVKIFPEKSTAIDEIVSLGFVNTSAKPTEAEILGKAALEKEALRVVYEMPRLVPTEHNAPMSPVYYVLPIKFNLPIRTVATPQPAVVENLSKLYLVDGKEVTEAEFKAVSVTDIEKLEVLKDASATATYGEKGKNGVILITRRK